MRTGNQNVDDLNKHRIIKGLLNKKWLKLTTKQEIRKQDHWLVLTEALGENGWQRRDRQGEYKRNCRPMEKDHVEGDILAFYSFNMYV